MMQDSGPAVPDHLVYVTDDMPGIRRLRRGKGFSYRHEDGSPIATADRERIRKLAIPPAYSGVWICPLPNGHLQTTGHDARGRKQYRYHAQWSSWRATAKYDQLADFGMALGRLRRRVLRDLQGEAGDFGF